MIDFSDWLSYRRSIVTTEFLQNLFVQIIINGNRNMLKICLN